MSTFSPRSPSSPRSSQPESPKPSSPKSPRSKGKPKEKPQAEGLTAEGIKRLATLPPEELKAEISRLTEAQAEELAYAWRLWARPNQIAPEGKWRTWLALAGRGFGKTRLGAEWVREKVYEGAQRIALVGRTAADTRDTVVLGESGIINVFPPSQRPIYEASKRRVLFHTGAIATLYSDEVPDALRGPQHEYSLCDEMAAWSNAQTTWAMLQMGLRLGRLPQAVVTTTPRPIPIIRDLLSRVASGTVVLTKGSTYDNAVNLAESFMDEVTNRYGSTRLGRQELFAEILEDAAGALWSRAMLEAAALTELPEGVALDRVVVAVDPSVSADGGGDECGIVAAGRGTDRRAYILRDASANASPDEWARSVILLANALDAAAIVYERNQGGALVESTIRLTFVAMNAGRAVNNEPPLYLPPLIPVNASVGKRARAEPISALYEQGRVSHLRGLHRLEDEMCSWEAKSGQPSPNRIDALVWAVTELAIVPGITSRRRGSRIATGFPF